MQNAPAVQHATAIALLANELRWMLMRAADTAGDAQHNTAEMHIAKKQEMLCACKAAAMEMQNNAEMQMQILQKRRRGALYTDSTHFAI